MRWPWAAMGLLWGAYGISFVIIFFVLLRPVMSIRTLNAGIRQEALRNKVHRLHKRTRVNRAPKTKTTSHCRFSYCSPIQCDHWPDYLCAAGNINLFYSPSEVAAGEAPIDRQIRVGGMVVEGSVRRASDRLETRFDGPTSFTQSP